MTRMSAGMERRRGTSGGNAGKAGLLAANHKTGPPGRFGVEWISKKESPVWFPVFQLNTL
jgi:hypothetical protein